MGRARKPHGRFGAGEKISVEFDGLLGTEKGKRDDEYFSTTENQHYKDYPLIIKYNGQTIWYEYCCRVDHGQQKRQSW